MKRFSDLSILNWSLQSNCFNKVEFVTRQQIESEIELNKFTGTSYIYAPSIICSYSRTLISIEILVTSCNFAAKLWSSSAFRQFLRHGNSNLVLDISHDHIISFRRPFVSSQAGSRYYFSLSNRKYFPVFLLCFVRNRRGDDADVIN